MRENIIGSQKINKKEEKKSKWDNFEEFVNILREYVENDYYGGFEGKIENGKIVDSKDWRRRKYKNNGKEQVSIYHRKHNLKAGY